MRTQKSPNKRMLADWLFAVLQTSRKCRRYVSEYLNKIKIIQA